MRRKRAWGADSINIAKSNDPFQYDKKSGEQAQALKNAPKARPSSGALKSVANAVARGVGGEGNSFYNQLGKAQGGRLKQIDTRGLSAKQIKILRDVVAGKNSGV